MDVKLIIKPERCRLKFGVGPCTASGPTKCYNTRTTCRDVPNIDLVEQEVVFTTSGVSEVAVPFVFADGTNLTVEPTAAIQKASIESGTLELEGVASENKAVVVLADEATLIEGDDPYIDDGRVNCGGTRWGRMLARNRLLHKTNAEICFRETSEDDWTATYWLIDEVTYPINNVLTLKLVDRITRKLDTPYPDIKPLILASAVSESTTAIQTIGTPPSEGSFWRIDSEIVRNVAGAWERSRLGTNAASHDLQTSVSPVSVFGGTWHDVYRQLFEDHLPGAVDEQDRLIQAANTINMLVSANVTRAEPFKTTLAQLCMAGQCSIFFDVFANRVRYRANAVFAEPEYLVSDSDFLEHRLPKVKSLPKAQKTRVSYRYGLSNPIDDRTYSKHVLHVEQDQEQALGYNIGDVIENKYAITGDAAAARRVQRYSTPPFDVSAVVPARKYKDVSIGDLVRFNYQDSYQGVDGCPLTLEMIITKYKVDLITGYKDLRGIVVNQTDSASVLNIFVLENAENVDVYNLAGQPIGPVIVNVNVGPDVVIGGVGSAALIIESFAANSTINVVMASGSQIIGSPGRGGAGGGGGRGNRGSAHPPNPGHPGSRGGDAILIDGNYGVHFTGTGSICGGGGGGGGGGGQHIAPHGIEGRGTIFGSRGLSGTRGAGYVPPRAFLSGSGRGASSAGFMGLGGGPGGGGGSGAYGPRDGSYFGAPISASQSGSPGGGRGGGQGGSRRFGSGLNPGGSGGEGGNGGFTINNVGTQAYITSEATVVCGTAPIEFQSAPAPSPEV